MPKKTKSLPTPPHAFFKACADGDIETVKEYLGGGFNINGLSQSMSGFLIAVSRARANVVDLLLTYPEIDINLADLHGHTPLICAVKAFEYSWLKEEDLKNLKHILKSLLFRKEAQNEHATPLVTDRTECRVNESKEGNTALHYACENGNFYAVILLLKIANINIYLKNHEGSMPLTIAASYGCSDIVAHFFSAYQKKKDKNLYKEFLEKIQPDILFFPAREGYFKVVEVLLNNHIDPNIRLRGGLTALMHTCRAYEGTQYEFILENFSRDGDYKNRIKNSKQKPKEIAEQLIEEGKEKILDLLLPDALELDKPRADVNLVVESNKWTALMFAAEKRDLNCVDKLFKNGANINASNILKRNALMSATIMGHFNVVKQLVDFEADLKQADYHGETALMHAIRGDKRDIALFLIEKTLDVDLDQTNVHGETAFMFAVLQGNCEMSKKLLDQGVNINHERQGGETILVRVVQDGDVEMIEFLLSQPNIDVTIEDDYGNTAFMRACQHCNRKEISAIYERLTHPLTDINKQNHYGSTALMLAIQANNQEAVDFLLEKKADMTLFNKNDPPRTACDIAMQMLQINNPIRKKLAPFSISSSASSFSSDIKYLSLSAAPPSVKKKGKKAPEPQPQLKQKDIIIQGQITGKEKQLKEKSHSWNLRSPLINAPFIVEYDPNNVGPMRNKVYKQEMENHVAFYGLSILCEEHYDDLRDDGVPEKIIDQIKSCDFGRIDVLKEGTKNVEGCKEIRFNYNAQLFRLIAVSTNMIFGKTHYPDLHLVCFIGTHDKIKHMRTNTRNLGEKLRRDAINACFEYLKHEVSPHNMQNEHPPNGGLEVLQGELHRNAMPGVPTYVEGSHVIN